MYAVAARRRPAASAEYCGLRIELRIGDCGFRSQRAIERQREQRQREGGDEIEMAEQVDGDIGRQSEHHGREHRRARMPRDRPRERVRAGQVQEDVREQQQILGADDREALQQRRGDERGQRRMRMVRDRRAERIEEIRRVEVGKPGCREDVPHPPQVPDEAVVVAGVAREGVADMEGQRPRPRHRESSEEQKRRAVNEKAVPDVGRHCTPTRLVRPLHQHGARPRTRRNADVFAQNHRPRASGF